jgi:DNA anti-recombination protein RmuC
LVKGLHYHIQQNFKDEEGSNQRPDVVLSLPEERRIVIDSKVSLTAYIRYTEAQTDAERKAALAEHISSVRKHFQELAAKEYQKLLNSPDFVVMFVPTEPAFLEALKADNTIWTDAYAKKIIISSPTNLFALLKMVGEMHRPIVIPKKTANPPMTGTGVRCNFLALGLSTRFFIIEILSIFGCIHNVPMKAKSAVSNIC